MNQFNHKSAFYSGATRYGGSSAAVAKRREAARKAFFTVKEIPSSSRSTTFNSSSLVNSYTINSNDIIRREPSTPQLTSSAKRILNWIEENSAAQQETLQLNKRRRTKHRYNPMAYRAPMAKILDAPKAPSPPPPILQSTKKIEFDWTIPSKSQVAISTPEPKIVAEVLPPTSSRFKSAKYCGPIKEIPPVTCQKKKFAAPRNLAPCEQSKPFQPPPVTSIFTAANSIGNATTGIATTINRPAITTATTTTVTASATAPATVPATTTTVATTTTTTGALKVSTNSIKAATNTIKATTTATTYTTTTITTTNTCTTAASTTTTIKNTSTVAAPITTATTTTPTFPIFSTNIYTSKPSESPRELSTPFAPMIHRAPMAKIVDSPKAPSPSPPVLQVTKKIEFDWTIPPKSKVAISTPEPKIIAEVAPPTSSRFKSATYRGPTKEVPSITCQTRKFAAPRDLAPREQSKPFQQPLITNIFTTATTTTTPISSTNTTVVVNSKSSEPPQESPVSLIPSVPPVFSANSVSSKSSPVVDVEMDIDPPSSVPASAVAAVPATAAPTVTATATPTLPLFMPPPSFPTPAFAQSVPPVSTLSMPNGSNPFQPASTVRGRKILRPHRRHR